MAFYIIVRELAELDTRQLGTRPYVPTGLDWINTLGKVSPRLYGLLKRVRQSHIAGLGTPKPISLCLPFNLKKKVH